MLSHLVTKVPLNRANCYAFSCRLAWGVLLGLIHTIHCWKIVPVKCLDMKYTMCVLLCNIISSWKCLVEDTKNEALSIFWPQVTFTGLPRKEFIFLATPLVNEFFFFPLFLLLKLQLTSFLQNKWFTQNVTLTDVLYSAQFCV